MLNYIISQTNHPLLINLRWFVEIIEIHRCLLYFAFDRYLIASIHWPIGPNLSLILESSLWCIRAMHVLSILFWTIHYLIRIHILRERLSTFSHQKIIRKYETNKVDLENRTAKFQIRKSTLLIIIALVSVSAIAYTFVYFLNVPSCSKLLETN